MELKKNMFFIRAPPLDLDQFPLFKGGTLMKNLLHKHPPNILRGGHVYPNLTQNTVRMGGIVFSVFDLG